MFGYRMILSVLAISAAATASAETAAPDAAVLDAAWKGNVEIGYVTTSGNTETESLNAKAKAETEREKWRHTVNLEALNSSDKNVTTAERYMLSGQSSFKMGPKNFFFVLLSYEDDRFSGYDYRVTESVGYGRRVLGEPTLTLDLEIGPGARQSKLDSGVNEDESLMRGAAKLMWKVSDTSKFTEDFSTEVGENETVTKSVTALSAKVNGSLSTKVSYTIKNTSDVPLGFKKTDSEMAVTLVFDL
jgi:putative salt-induced outer membrane protein